MVKTGKAVKDEIVKELDSLDIDDLLYIKSQIATRKAQKTPTSVYVSNGPTYIYGTGVIKGNYYVQQYPTDSYKPDLVAFPDSFQTGSNTNRDINQIQESREKVKIKMYREGLILGTNNKWRYVKGSRKYVKSEGDVWKIRVFFETISDDLYPILSDTVVEVIFSIASFCFYLDQRGSYLFIQTSKELESQIGELTPISALDALKRFGLDVLEEVKEKSYANVSTNVQVA